MDTTGDTSISGRTDDLALFDTQQLLVASNRQPYRHEQTAKGLAVDRPTGGLTASLDPVMQRTGGTWIAWGDGDGDRAAVDEHDEVAVPPEDPKYTLRRLWLTDDEVDDYYYGFSNRVLWPICHSSLATVDAESDYWTAYKRTNERFAEAIATAADGQCMVWLQDYHLALAPWLVRLELGADAVISQFWHIPWPAWDTFRACPYRAELLRGLLGNDVLTVHVKRYEDNFLECVEAALSNATVDWNAGTVSYRGGTTWVRSVPMGVPTDEIRNQASTYSREDMQAFTARYDIDDSSKIALGVDRLDYSKGIPARMRGLEQFWEEYPEWQGRLTYVQNDHESRGKIPAYRREQEAVSDATERVNGRFGTDDWTPIVRIDEHLTQRELYGLYRHADVGVVTPIRDGLNLVAGEYVTAQLDADGALVLSTQTGAHDLFGGPALSVPPFDTDRFAEQLHAAVTMPTAERRDRMRQMQGIVAAHDLDNWIARNVETAAQVTRARQQPVSHDPR